MLFSFTGPQSSGKTTLLQECRKKNESGEFNRYIEVIANITRDVGAKHPINEKGTDWTQLLILNKHVENVSRFYTLLDRCIVDGFLYTEYLFETKAVSRGIYEYAHYLYHELLLEMYDTIFYPNPREIELIDDGVRSTSVEFREIMIAKFEREIVNNPKLRSKVIVLSGTVEERVKELTKILKCKIV